MYLFIILYQETRQCLVQSVAQNMTRALYLRRTFSWGYIRYIITSIYPLQVE